MSGWDSGVEGKAPCARVVGELDAVNVLVEDLRFGLIMTSVQLSSMYAGAPSGVETWMFGRNLVIVTPLSLFSDISTGRRETASASEAVVVRRMGAPSANWIDR